MLVADAVVGEQPLLRRFGNALRTDLGAVGRHRRRSLEDIERAAGVAAGEVEQRRTTLRAEPDPAAEAAIRIGEGAIGDLAERIGVEGIQPIDPHPRQQRRVDLVVRVLGGGADQRDRALLDVRQQRILLALVEPMQLVDEGDHRAARLSQRLRLGHQRADVGHAARHRAQLTPRAAGAIREEPRECRLPASRWPPQDERRTMAGLDDAGQGSVGADEVRLADEFLERPRAHPRRKRRIGKGGLAEQRLRGVGGLSASRHAPIMMRGMEQNLRTPGPTPIPAAVREAQAQQMIDHRGTEFAELLRETSDGLAELIGTDWRRPAADRLRVGRARGRRGQHALPRRPRPRGHHRLVRRSIRADRGRVRRRRRALRGRMGQRRRSGRAPRPPRLP